MNRRGFLGALAAGAAAFAIDPERALWVPGAKTISIPRPRVITISSRLRLEFEIGDIIRFGGDPQPYTVTAVQPDARTFLEFKRLPIGSATTWHSTPRGPRESVFSRV